MIQFNLLPDIKVEYLRANRQKHIVVLVSVIAALASLAVLAGLVLTVFVFQKKSISDLSADIKKASSELQSTPELTKILTVQNQLKALTELHNDKPVATRLFSYLEQSTPANAVNSRVLVDFTQNTMILTGISDSLSTVNTYIDSLKGTTYHTDQDTETEVRAFSNVVLASFGRDTQSASYSITLTFDPIIFSEVDEVVFSISAVPKNGAGQ